VFHGEKGYLVSASYSKLHAYDREGNLIKTFEGGANHFQNFLDAVKSDDPQAVNASAAEGHLSSSLCHLGNISYQLGAPAPLSADRPFGGEELANESFRRFRDHLVENGVAADETSVALGPKLAFDGTTERFIGDRADEANPRLTRAYREGFVVPGASVS
jgi:hypothetical protein